MEGFDKEFVIIICNLRELTVVFDDSQGIEGTCYDECDECRNSFLFLDFKNIKYLFISFFYRVLGIPLFFRKNLTRRKFTGMQMQRVGIIASCLARPKPTKRLRQRVCIE